MFLLNRLPRMFGRPSRRRLLRPGRNRLRSTVKLHLESMEGRLCPSGSYLLVGSFDNNSVLRYSETTGAFVDQLDPHNLANLKNPSAGVFGPDGNLYVSSNIFQKNSNWKVVEYDGKTGAFLRVFASQNITSPRGLLFGPDGNLYVANGNSVADSDPASVERFDGKTGAFLNYFVAPASGGLEHPSYMVFGPDGQNDGKLDLYVAAAHEGAIYRYDGTTGAFKGVFVTAASGGLDSPQGMAFGADGNLYVASGNWFTSSNGPFYSGNFPPGAVLEFQGPSGQGPSGQKPGDYLSTFVAGGSGGLANPVGMLFGPDPSGNGNTDLYVASSALVNFKGQQGTSEVLRYDGTSGAFLGTLVAPDSGGLKFPTFLAFTETDPTTLNYVQPKLALNSAVVSAPIPAAAGTAFAQRSRSGSAADLSGALMSASPSTSHNCIPSLAWGKSWPILALQTATGSLAAPQTMSSLPAATSASPLSAHLTVPAKDGWLTDFGSNLVADILAENLAVALIH